MNHRPFPVCAVRFVFLGFAAVVMSAAGCGSDSTAVGEVNQSELTKARDQASAAETKLKDAQENAKLLAVKIETLVDDRNRLKLERDNLRADVAKAGEQFAAVQTQFSELRARSAEFNTALELLSETISGTQDDPAETGIAIFPRDMEDKTDGGTGDASPLVFGPPELADTDPSPGVFANPEPADSEPADSETETE